MDDSDDETLYPSRPTSIYTPSLRSRRPIRNPSSYSRNPQYGYSNNNESFQYNNDNESSEDCEEDDSSEEENNNGYGHNNSTFQVVSKNNNNQKKRKMESLVSNYEFASRGNVGMLWSEEESFVLLEVWGERFLELGRRSLRGEDWVEVAEKVTEMIGVEKSEKECREQLDVLKKKYKKEIGKMERNGRGFVSKWAFFKKMDMLMNLRMKGYCGLGCGVDSGEYVFMDPRMYLDKSNVLDEMRDSPAGSDAEEDGEEEEEKRGEGDEESAKMLADSIQRFGQIYEKIESSKRKQMMELEKMRRDFQRELELQKKQIVDRAHAEIAKIRDGGEDDDDDEDNEDEVGDEEADNVSGEKLRG